MDVFDLVDGPKTARMIFTVMKIAEKVDVGELTLMRFPVQIVEPIFTEFNPDYIMKMAMAIMIAYKEKEDTDSPGFELYQSDVDRVSMAIVKESMCYISEILDIPAEAVPEGFGGALSDALVKWSEKKETDFEKKLIAVLEKRR